MPRKSETAGTLRRGSACLSCRRRKLRCDGTRPVCKQCTTMRRGHDCEYDDSARKSRTQTLREKLAALEAKVLELEYQPGPSQHLTALRFQDSSSSSSSSSSTPPPSFDSFADQASFNLDPALFGQWLDDSTLWEANGVESSLFSGASFPSTFPVIQGFCSPHALTPKTSSSHSNPSASPPNITNLLFAQESNAFDLGGGFDVFANSPDQSYGDEQEPNLPHHIRAALIRSFHLHRFQCCFYADVDRLESSPSNATPSASPALISTALLLGCFFAQKGTFSSGLESQLLQEALYEVSTALHSQAQLLDVVQALALLAQYFFFNHRNMEANRHLMAAKRMAIELRLHKVAHPDLTIFPFNLENPFTVGSQLTTGAVMQEGVMGVSEAVSFEDVQGDWCDQTQVFWQIFMVDCLWSAGNQFALTMPDFDGRCQNITTPLPVLDGDLEATIKNSPLSSLFAPDPHAFQTSSLTTTAFKVMASCIFNRSMRIRLHDLPVQDNSDWAYHNSVELALQRLVRMLPEFSGKEPNTQNQPNFDAELFTVHMLVLASSIQLNVDNVMNLKVSLAAKNMVELINHLNNEDFAYLDPALIVCWSSLIKIFQQMVNSITPQSSGNAAPSNATYSTVFLRRCIDVLLSAIRQMTLCKSLTRHALKESQSNQQPEQRLLCYQNLDMNRQQEYTSSTFSY